MKLRKNNLLLPIIFIIGVSLLLISNIILGVYPVLDFFKSIERTRYFEIIPIMMAFFSGIFMLRRSTKKRIINERIEIYTATIRTIQDILQNSASSMQLLILDMKDANVNDDIVTKAEKNVDELRAVIKTLAAVDPESIQLKELNKNLSIIKMHE